MSVETKFGNFSVTRTARNRFSHDSLFRSIEEARSSIKTPDDDLLINSLFKTVVSPTLNVPKQRTTSSDLKSVRKVTGLVLEAIDEGSLSEDEGDAVLNLLIEGFALRRLDKIFSNISDLDRDDWFLAASKVMSHEQ